MLLQIQNKGFAGSSHAVYCQNRATCACEQATLVHKNTLGQRMHCTGC